MYALIREYTRVSAVLCNPTRCKRNDDVHTTHALVGAQSEQPLIHTFVLAIGLQCFDAVSWAAGRASGL